MEYLEWMYGKFGNVSRYTMAMMGMLSPHLKIWLRVCDDVYGHTHYYLTDVIKVCKDLQAKLVIVCVCLARLKDKRRPRLTNQSSNDKTKTRKRLREETHDPPQSNERTRITRKTGV